MENFPILTVIIFAPVISAIIMAFIPRERETAIRRVAASGTITSLVLTLYVYAMYDVKAAGLQFVENIPWIKDLGVSYFMAVDGISLAMVLLTNLVGVAAVFTSWSIANRNREFFILVCLLISGLMGTFVAHDLFIFLLFYEVFVIPIYIMIVVFGTTKRLTKEYAGMKLVIYLLVGSGFLLAGLIAFYVKSIAILGEPNMSFEALATAGRQMSAFDQKWIFALMALGFCPLVTMFPFHSWSPDGHAGAPTAVSMLHAGVFKKIGAYGLIKIAFSFLPLGGMFWAPYLAGLAVIGVVYAAFNALVQKDLKYIVGYSSVSHMNYVILAIASTSAVGFTGAVANMFAHGVMSAMFFSAVGFIYNKTNTRWIPDLGGLARQMPRLAVAFMVAGFATLGLPGLISFIPEFTIFLASFEVYGGLAVVAIAGIIITALYALRAGANTLFGPPKEEFNHLKDIRGTELVPVLVLGIVVVVGGLLPSLLFDMVDSGVTPLMNQIDSVLKIGGIR